MAFYTVLMERMKPGVVRFYSTLELRQHFFFSGTYMILLPHYSYFALCLLFGTVHIW